MNTSFIRTTRQAAEDALIRATNAVGGGGGGGITQLTGDVIAGPGAGSQAATVVQITGAAGVANVVSGTDLSFLQAGVSVSTNGRINFDRSASTKIGIRRGDNGTDTIVLAYDGVGQNLFFGDNSGTGNNSHYGGFQTRLSAAGDNNQIHLSNVGDINIIAEGSDAPSSNVNFMVNGNIFIGPGNGASTHPNLMMQFGVNPTSTSGRINFTQDTQNPMSFETAGGGGVDVPFISLSGDNVFFGPIDSHAGVGYRGPGGNQILSTSLAGGFSANTTKWTFQSTPTFFDALSNAQFGSTVAEFGSGTGVIGIANATANPSTNPVGGGVLYASAGSLFWRNPAGVVTPIAP